MRILFYIIGVLLISIGVVGIVSSMMSDSDRYVLVGTGVGFIALFGGILLFLFGFKNYQGSWPTIFGTLHLCFSILGFYGVILSQWYPSKFYTRENLLFNCISFLFFLVMGLLLLHSGHKLHKLLLELDQARRKLSINA